MKKVVLLMTTLLLGITTQADLINNGFNSAPVGVITNDVGEAAAGLDTSTDAAGRLLEVISSGPLAGAGDNSLHVYDNNNYKAPIINLTGDVVSGSGQFFISFNVASITGDGFRIRLDPTYNAIDLKFADDGVGGISVSLDQGSGFALLANTAAVGVDQSLIINFNTDTDTFSGTLNGVALNDGDTTMNFTNPSGGISYTRIALAYSSQTDLYLDDIALVPEPATLSLVVISGCALFIARRCRM